ncbi:MAG: hypothetical protein WCC17_10460 [Candidatus Nitrosopolaris sp.]
MTIEIDIRLKGVLIITLPILVLSISVIFNYSLYQTFAQNDFAAGAKTTTSVTIQHDNNPMLQISSSKQTYKPGETVVITVKNNGKYTLEFPDSVLGLTIQGTKTQEKAGLLGLQVISQLKPKESKTFQWNQKDIDGKQVQPGTYDARTSVSSYSSRVPPVAASTTFAINSNS